MSSQAPAHRCGETGSCYDLFTKSNMKAQQMKQTLKQVTSLMEQTLQQVTSRTQNLLPFIIPPPHRA